MSAASAPVRTFWTASRCLTGIASSWRSSMTVRPPQLVVTGAPNSSATSTRASHAACPACTTPEPAWIIGASAPANRSAAASSCSADGASGCTARYRCGAWNQRPPASGSTAVFITLSGMSTCTTPGRPSWSRRKARRITSPTRSTEGTATDHLVMGAVTSTCGKHWNVPPRSG